MTDTPFIQAAFTGQTAGELLSAYVPQSGDVPANVAFSAAAYLATTTLSFSSSGPLILTTAGTGTNDINYICTTEPTTNNIDITMTIKVASLVGTSFCGFSFANDNTGNNLVNVYWNPNTGTGNNDIVIQTVVGGTKVAAQNTSGFTGVAGTSYQLQAQIRNAGTSGATVQLFFGTLGSTLTAVAAAYTIANLTIQGRYLGVRQVWPASAGTQAATTGAQIQAFEAANYTSLSALTAGTITSTPEGAGDVTLTASGDAGGTTPYSWQFFQAPDNSGSPGSYTSLGASSTTSTKAVTGLTVGSYYWFYYTVTDSEGTPATANATAIRVQSPASTLAAGTVSTVAAGTTSATVTTTAATGGTAPYGYQFQQAPNVSGAPGTWANIGTASTSLSVTATGLTAGTEYWYRVAVTDAEPITVDSAAVSYAVAAPTFAVATSPSSLIMAQNSTAVVSVVLTASGGYTGTDTLSVTGLPTGVTAAFSPATITNGVGTSIMTMTASGAAVTGNATLTVTASDGTATNTAPVAATVITGASGTTLDTVNNNVTGLQSALAGLASRLQTRWF
jgi:hypothetical protein